MRTKLKITDTFIDDEIFSLGLEDNTLMVLHDDENSFLDNLKKKEKYIYDMKHQLQISYDLIGSDEDEKKYYDDKNDWEYFLYRFDNIIDIVDLIYINLDCNIKEFLNTYPILKDKNIVLPEYITISNFDRINMLIEEYKDFSNIYVTLQGNAEPVRLDECEKIMMVIKNYADYIKSLNLSPLESTLLAYDIVRERVYKEEESDDYTESRDIRNVLFGKAIVCAGYAKVLSCILCELGIKNDLVHMDEKEGESGHLRNAIYADDPKYNVKGYYYLDATWDSKRNDNNNYLLVYNWFLKTRDEMEEKENYQFTYKGTEYYTKDLEHEIEEFLLDDDKLEIMRRISTVNRLYRTALNVKTDALKAKDVFIGRDINIESIKRKIRRMMKHLNKSIDAETYIALVNNVRKVEYYIDSEKYPYSLEALYCIYLNSGWEFSDKHYNREALVMANLFGISKEELYNPEKDFANYVHYDSNIGTTPSGVKLAKTLRKVLEKKSHLN